MQQISRALAALIVLALASGWAAAQDEKKDEVKPPPRLKGQLPANYRALGLSEEQRQAIYKVQNDFDAKLAALEDQIKKLKTEERAAIEKILTDAQRARLKEILKEKVGGTGTSPR